MWQQRLPGEIVEGFLVMKMVDQRADIGKQRLGTVVWWQGSWRGLCPALQFRKYGLP